MHDQLGVHELDGVDCLTRDELNGGLGELAILVDVFVERLAGYVLHDERADLAAAAAELELDTKQAHYVRMIQVEESLEFAAKQHVGLLHELVVAQHELALDGDELVLAVAAVAVVARRARQVDHAERALAEYLKGRVLVCHLARRLEHACLQKCTHTLTYMILTFL